MPFQDAELEKFYAYWRLLINKLPKKGISEKLKLNDEVALEYYRLWHKKGRRRICGAF